MISQNHHNQPNHRYYHHRHHYPERGWIQFLILRTLYETPMHGYQLMEQMEERGYVLPRRLESGAVYTVLRRMEKHGLLQSKWERKDSGRERRTYKLTDEGVEALQKGLETILKREALMKDLKAFYHKHFEG